MKVRKLLISMMLIIYIIIVGSAMSGCDVSSLSTNGEYKEKNYVAKNSIHKIVVDNHLVDTIFTLSRDGNIHVTCYENNKYNYEITESEDGTLKIRKNDLKKLTIFELPSDLQQVTIEVPESFKGDIEINAGRGELLINDIKARNIQILSERGITNIDRVEVLESIKIEGNRDEISLVDSNIGNEIFIENERGDINFQNLECGYKLEINNYRGNILGTIKGSIEDYSITSKIERGECNLPSSMKGGVKNINLETGRGDINVIFSK